MAKRNLALRRKQQNTGGGWLVIAAVLLAVAACVLVSPPTPAQLAAVFAHETPLPAAAAAAVTLPQRSWYLVISNGQAVAACDALLEAEIIREAKGELASIESLTAEEVELRITASTTQLEALRQSADAIMETFGTLSTMAHLSTMEGVAAAQIHYATLDALCDSLDKTLSGTDNPVVRGLAGLVGSSREAMRDLTGNASPDLVRKAAATLAQQYAAYVQFLSSGV